MGEDDDAVVQTVLTLLNNPLLIESEQILKDDGKRCRLFCYSISAYAVTELIDLLCGRDDFIDAFSDVVAVVKNSCHLFAKSIAGEWSLKVHNNLAADDISNRDTEMIRAAAQVSLIVH